MTCILRKALTSKNTCPCSLLNCLDVTLLEASSKTNSGRIWCRVYYENDLIGKHMRANRVNIQYPAQ